MIPINFYCSVILYFLFAILSSLWSVISWLFNNSCELIERAERSSRLYALNGIFDENFVEEALADM